ncbi:MAG: DUF4159 domain-containing protein [Gemmatimonadetes bacterium]|jgi:hypothetical protein|nr:DUF4159 domain-containing protein [Gemmatimonadota bacterium]
MWLRNVIALCPALVCLALAWPVGVDATIYTIAPDGQDLSPCTGEEPCASVRRASQLLVPGDTLHVVSASGSDWLTRVASEASRELKQVRGGRVLDAGGDQLLGFVRLAQAWSTTLRPQFPSAAKAMPNLVDALARQTRIAAIVDRHMFIGSPEFERSPFVFITADRAFELTDAEAASLKVHLQTGGFLFVDSAEPHLEFSQAEAALRDMFRRALGRRAQLRRIADHHPIFAAPYAFNGAPPGLDLARPRHALEGLFLEGRLVALFSDRGYVHSLAQSDGNEAQMRLLINAVHYALQHSEKANRIVLRRVDPVPPTP